jgi:hypothetical protein
LFLMSRIRLDLLLRKARLSLRQIDDSDAHLEVQRQIRFLNLVAEALGDDLLGSTCRKISTHEQ